jgi:hypothetical protein
MQVDSRSSYYAALLDAVPIDTKYRRKNIADKPRATREKLATTWRLNIKAKNNLKMKVNTRVLLLLIIIIIHPPLR